MVYTVGECPVDVDAIPYVVALSGSPTVLLYCPSCECAWLDLSDVERNTIRDLGGFGLSEATIRYATQDEILVAGHAITGTCAPPCPLPRSA